MDRRRILISIKGDKFNPEDAIFSGTCTAKTVDAYWGAGAGKECIHYIDNKDGTYTYYMINSNRWKQWWDRFIWYNSNAVKSLKLSQDTQIWELNNNRFNSPSIESYDFGAKQDKDKIIERVVL